MDISHLRACEHLEGEWQQWLTENLQRGVPADTLADTLRSNGYAQAADALLSDAGIDKKSPKPLPKMDISHNYVQLADARVEIIFTCDKPVVVVLDNFLSHAECDALVASAQDKFQEARVVDPQSGAFVKHKDRTSINAAFKRGETGLIRTIEARIAQLLHWPVENGEGLQVLWYNIGGEYKNHFDYFDAKHPGERKNLERGGQRVGTFLMYLSDVEAGGATRFPIMNFEVRPKKGMALYFGDMLASGEGDKLSLHAGTPVIAGTKYLATKWLREREFV